jgi:hypothetical protein
MMSFFWKIVVIITENNCHLLRRPAQGEVPPSSDKKNILAVNGHPSGNTDSESHACLEMFTTATERGRMQ